MAPLERVAITKAEPAEVRCQFERHGGSTTGQRDRATRTNLTRTDLAQYCRLASYPEPTRDQVYPLLIPRSQVRDLPGPWRFAGNSSAQITKRWVMRAHRAYVVSYTHPFVWLYRWRFCAHTGDLGSHPAPPRSDSAGVEYPAQHDAQGRFHSCRRFDLQVLTYLLHHSDRSLAAMAQVVSELG